MLKGCCLYAINPVWPDGYLIISIFGYLELGKFAHKYEIFAKVGSQFCQILRTNYA